MNARTEEPAHDAFAMRMRKASEDRLERFLIDALQALEQGIAVFDVGDRLLFCNEAYRSLLGAAGAGALIGQHHEQILEAWLRELHFANDRERLHFRNECLLQRRGNHGNELDFEVRTTGGRSLRISDRCTPGGGVVTTIIDHTDDVRRASELCGARAVAEAASATKSQFVCVMSHELRTPLNAMLGFTQLLQRDPKLILPDRHRRWVEQVLKGGQHLLRIIDDLLDLSRIEAGQMTISLEPVDAQAVLEQVCTTLRPTATDAGIQLHVQAAPPRAPKIAADGTRLAQILMNFGSNAIKYNRADGNVSFAVCTPCPGYVRISVSDTGLGIPEDKQSHLFEPFQRAGQEKGTIEGTGMGLAITKRLAELMHGAVGFRSACTRGSEFWVDMPVHVAGGPTPSTV